jgi:cyanophycinase
MRTRIVVTLAVAASFAASPAAQKSSGPDTGTLIVDGGGGTKPVVARFVDAAGGNNARIVVVATGPSALRFGRQNVVLNPDWPRDRPEWQQYEEYLEDWFGVPSVQVIHTRDRDIANSEAFTAPLKSATGVYLIAGNAGRYADAYLNTRTYTELQSVLARGGVIFGSSAGAIALGSFLVRGNPDKPLLMATGRTTGFGFLRNVAINPHVTSAQRDAELVNVVDAHPGVLGLGIEDDAAIVVNKNRFEVIGTGRVAVYDNVRRNGLWYFWLRSEEQFDLATWATVGGPTASAHNIMFGPIQLVPIFAAAAIGIIAIWPAWRIAQKAGYSGLVRIWSCVPIVNWFTLAFAEWPIERDIKRVRAAGR